MHKIFYEKRHVVLTPCEEFILAKSTIPLCTGLKVFKHLVVQQLVSINSPQEVKMSKKFKFHLMVHSRHNVWQSRDSMKNVPWHGKVIIVTPVQSNRCFNVL